MRQFLTNKGKIYDHFLEASAQCFHNSDDLNVNEIVHFLCFGAMYFENTFINNIKKKFTHQNVRLVPDHGFIPENENVLLTHSPLQEDPLKTFISFFEQRVKQLENFRISIDLTGGIDSRLVACMLKNAGIPFDAVFSMGSGSDKEAEVVKQVAKLLDCRLQIIETESVRDDDHLFELFRVGDGCWDITRLNSLYHTQKWRSDNSYDLVISGMGGELYKDFWWHQDFPFYNKKKSNLGKLLSYRMYPVEIPDDWFHPKTAMSYDICKNQLLSELKKKQKSTNSRTYDTIYHEIRIKEQVSALTKASSNFITVYSPLLEQELLQTGYNLPRKERFFNRFHRRIISSLNPEIAAVPTTEGGMSVSNSTVNLCKDACKYAGSKSIKLLNKINRSGFKRSKTDGKSGEESNRFLEDRVTRSLTTLKNVEIFSENAPSKALELPSAIWGRVLTVAMFIEHLQK